MNKYAIVLLAVVLAVTAVGAWTAHHLITEGRITPNDKFFVVSIGDPPQVDVETWSLTIDGTVNETANVTYGSLTSMPAVNETEVLKCVEGPSGTAVWTGVRVRDVLALAGIANGSREVVFHGADGYSSSLTLDEALGDDVLFAWGMNHEPLPREQGYPLRVVAPGKAGYKWVKFVERVEVVDYDYKGYWESRGWNDTADNSVVTTWPYHAVLLTLAAAMGALAAVSGAHLSGTRNFWSDLPDRFGKRFHDATSKGYGLVAFPTLVYWMVVIQRDRGSVLHSGHGVLGAISLASMAIGGVAGGALALGMERGRAVHRYATILSLLMMLAAVFTGLLKI